MPPRRRQPAEEDDESLEPSASDDSDDDELQPTSDSEPDDDGDDDDEDAVRRPAKRRQSAPPKKAARAAATPKKAVKATKAVSTSAAKKLTTKQKKLVDPNFVPRKYSKTQTAIYSQNRFSKMRERWVFNAGRELALRNAPRPSKEFRVLVPVLHAVATSARPRAEWLNERSIPVEVPPVTVETCCEDPVTFALPSLASRFLDHADFVLNAAGPVACMAFSPDSDTLVVGVTRLGWPGEQDYESAQSAAGVLGPRASSVTTTRALGFGSDFVRNVGIRETHDNLLQIWDVSEGASLAYEVALPRRGAVRSLSFLPGSCGDECAGVVAVVCGDGSCQVLALPRASAALKGRVLAEKPCTLLQFTEGALVTFADFAPAQPHDLCLSFSDGSAAIHAIQTSASAAWKSARLVQLNDFSSVPQAPSAFACAQARVCPYDPRLVASTSADGTLRLWHVAEPHRPRFARKMTALGPLQWDPDGGGVYFADTETAQVMWERGWAPGITSNQRLGLFPHSVETGMVHDCCVAVHEGMTCLYSAASDGTVRGGYVAALCSGKPPMDCIIQCLAVARVRSDPPSATLALGPLVLAVDDIGNSAHIDDQDPRRHALAATALAIADQEDGHLLACGLACGLVRVHLVNPRSLLVEDA